MNNGNMLESFERILEGNRLWAAQQKFADPKFFSNLAQGQHPDYMWIGCSDSRVPANEITGTIPGQIFVHRNVANLVVHTDINLLSVLHYAVNVLRVHHVIVCGHYGCGGVITSMTNQNVGIVNKWLRHIKETYNRNLEELTSIEELEARQDRLVELNVMEQVHNLAKTSIVQAAWKERRLTLHGLVYSLKDGLLRDLNCMIHGLDDLEPIFHFDDPSPAGDSH